MLDFILRLICCQPMDFPTSGRSWTAFTTRLRGEAPENWPKLLSWLRLTVLLLAFQVVWAAAYTVIAFSRRLAIGMILNPFYVGAAVTGIVGCISLSWPLLAISICSSFFVCVLFFVFVFLNYATSLEADDSQAWVVLALFIPGLAADLVIAAMCLPLLRQLLVAERATRAAAASHEIEAQGSDVTATAEEVADAQRVRTCPVCLDRAPDTVLLNCKHMVCSHCATQLPSKKCPVCRSAFKSTMKVFLG